MDDVLADAIGQFISFYEKEFGVRMTKESMYYKEEMKRFPEHHEEVYQFTFRKDFFKGVLKIQFPFIISPRASRGETGLPSQRHGMS